MERTCSAASGFWRQFSGPGTRRRRPRPRRRLHRPRHRRCSAAWPSPGRWLVFS